MKKIASILLLLAGLFCTQAWAENYWPRTYFVQAGFNAGFSTGDLNERAFSIEDTTGGKMRVYPPDLGFMATPEFIVGSNMRFFSIALMFQYSFTGNDLTALKEPDEEATPSVSMWRFGFEFTYNINWPEDFQVGVGLGYSFSTLKASNSTYQDSDIYDTEFMGLGVSFIVNAHYYFTDHIAVVPAVKIYENWFKNVYTGPSELCDMDPYKWQTFYTMSLSVQYQF